MTFKKGEIPKGAKPWKPGQSGNPAGGPRKNTRIVIEELKEKGIERITSAHVQEIFEMIMNTNEEELLEIVQDKNQPMILRIAIKQMLKDKGGWETVKDLLDRAHGKSTQKIAGPDGEKLPITGVTIQIIQPNDGTQDTSGAGIPQELPKQEADHPQ